LTNAAGTTTTYRINSGGNHETQPGGTAGETIDVFIQFASSVAHIAEAITKAINATTNADMTATNDGTNITVTQTTKGTAGNKTNTDNSTGLSSVGNFTGAVGQWTTAGGDYHASPAFTQSFDVGNENLEVNVTTLVDEWITGPDSGGKSNYGFGVKLSASYEASSSTNENGARFSYYTKKFFARSSEYYFDRPVLEARWDSTRKDNRGNFYFSSSLAPAKENLNTLYMYNYIRGNLRDIAGDSSAIPVLNLYYASGSVPEGTAIYFKNSSDSAVNFLSASREDTGVYKATFSVTGGAVNSTYPYLVDVWTMSGSELHTGSVITPNKHSFSNYNPNTKYVINIKNLKTKYTRGQTERFRLYVREKNWSPNIYTVAKTTPKNTLIESASYQICRAQDQKIVIPYGTGSTYETMLSYDSDGNYFDLDMDLLEAGYTYEVKFSFYEDSLLSYREQPYKFKIRVEQNEY